MVEKEASLGQNTYSKGDSKLSLVNENKDTNSEKVIPPSTKVWNETRDRLSDKLQWFSQYRQEKYNNLQRWKCDILYERCK